MQLKKGDLFREQRHFGKAEPLIREALDYFCRRDSAKMIEGDATDKGRGFSGSVERWETTLRLGELMLNLQQSDTELEDENPEPLIRQAKDGLERTAGHNHTLTLKRLSFLVKSAWRRRA